MASNPQFAIEVLSLLANDIRESPTAEMSQFLTRSMHIAIKGYFAEEKTADAALKFGPPAVRLLDDLEQMVSHVLHPRGS